METRVAFVHGIGDHKEHYSDTWRDNFNRYLLLPSANYAEVLWEPALDGRGTRGTGELITLTADEELQKAAIEAELQTFLAAREASPADGLGDTRAQREAVVEWGVAETRGFLDWILHPNEYLGDFVRYLVNGSIREAVKKEFKSVVRDLDTDGDRLVVIAHSWGTVVAYDALLDLAKEGRHASTVLFTLGSPLWLVRRLLQDSSGRKPAATPLWVNIHARGDRVGSWLKPGYQVDHDYEVPSIAGTGAHSSYFHADNAQVQEQIVASSIAEVGV